MEATMGLDGLNRSFQLLTSKLSGFLQSLNFGLVGYSNSKGRHADLIWKPGILITSGP